MPDSNPISPEQLRAGPFNRQLRHYFQQFFGDSGQPYNEFAETLGGGVTANDVKSYLMGDDVPNAAVTEEMADVFMLQSYSGSPANRKGEREAFTEAAFRKRPLKMIVGDYAKENGLGSTTAIAETFKTTPETLRGALERGNFSERRIAASAARQLRLNRHMERSFFEKFGGFYVDADHLMSTLETKPLGFGTVISALRDINGFSAEDLVEKTGASLSAVRSWFWADKPHMPSREEVIKLASEKCFNLTLREHKEKFFGSFGYFIDAEHVAADLEKNKIDMFAAFRGLISLRAESLNDYAKHTKLAPGTISKWGRTKLIPRDRVAELITDLPEERRRMVMEKAGFFTSAEHIDQYFSNAASNDLGAMIDAWKSTYHFANNFTGVSSASMIKIKAASTFTPSETILVQIFADACSVEPKIRCCWNTYKDVAARYLGYGNHGLKHEKFLATMDEELGRREKFIKENLGAFAELVLRPANPGKGGASRSGGDS